MTLFLNYLWGQVLWSPTDRECLTIVLYVVLGEPKVSEFDIALGVDEHILRFQTE